QLSTPDSDGNTYIIRSGGTEIDISDDEYIDSFILRAAMDGGYMDVYAVRPYSTVSTSANMSIPTTNYSVFVIFFRPEKQDRTGPFLIYRPNYLLNDLSPLICLEADDRIGYQCVLGEVTGGNPPEQEKTKYVLVRFLSSGSVRSVTDLELPENINMTDYSLRNMLSLQFGGFILLLSNLDNQFACIFDKNGKFYDTFELPPRLHPPMGILSNNTMWILESSNQGSWSI
ncbi:hypothetical protein C1645_528940, partial [Glomus cerebriforme]